MGARPEPSRERARRRPGGPRYLFVWYLLLPSLAVGRGPFALGRSRSLGGTKVWSGEPSTGGAQRQRNWAHEPRLIEGWSLFLGNPAVLAGRNGLVSVVP